MKKIFTFMIGVLFLFGAISIPHTSIVFAQDVPCGTDATDVPCATEGQNQTDGTNNGNQSQGSSGTSFAIKINNPLKNITTLNGLIVKLLNIILTIGVPFVALMIIYSGFLFVKAQGDPKELGTAKETLKWTLIGGTILLSAWIIAKALAGTVNQIVNGS